MAKILVLYDKWMRENAQEMWRTAFDEAVSAMVRFRDPVIPDEKRHTEYSKNYSKWLETRRRIALL